MCISRAAQLFLHVLPEQRHLQCCHDFRWLSGRGPGDDRSLGTLKVRMDGLRAPDGAVGASDHCRGVGPDDL